MYCGRMNKPTYTVSALDMTKPVHDLSAYVSRTFDTKKAAKAKIVSLLKIGRYTQISVKEIE
jgi:hypothetical protein